MKVAFFGIGKVGTALALAAYEAGAEIVALVNRREDVARALVQRVECTRVGADASVIPDEVDVVFLTVSDGAIAEVAATLPTHVREQALVVHCSGAQTADILKGCDYRVSIHPLQTFADVEAAVEKIPETTFGVEGPKAELGVEWVKFIGGKSVVIPSDKKVAYHLAGVFASNNLVGVLDAAIQLFQQTGATQIEALEALQPIIEATLENVYQRGTRGALTGPVKRGDWETVERHREYLKKEHPRLYNVYDPLVELLKNLS